MKPVLILSVLAIAPAFAYADPANEEAARLKISELTKTHCNEKHPAPHAASCPICSARYKQLVAEFNGQGPTQDRGITSVTSVIVTPPAINAEVVEAARKNAEAQAEIDRKAANAKKAARLADVEYESYRPAREFALSAVKAGKMTHTEAMKRMGVASPARAAIVNRYQTGSIDYDEAMRQLRADYVASNKLRTGT